MPPSTPTAPRGWIAHFTLIGLSALATFSVSCFVSMANPWFVFALHGKVPLSWVVAIIELNAIAMLAILTANPARRSVGLTVALTVWAALPLGAFVGFASLQ